MANVFFKAFCRVYQKVIYLVEFFLPWGEPEMLTGPGSIRKLPEFVKSKGVDNVLIVTDKGLTSLGLLNSLYEEMDNAGVEYVVYDGTQPNPTIENVQTGVEAFKAAGTDCIVAIGGGSSMDTAKAVGIIINNPEYADVRSLEGVAPTKKPCVPIIAEIYKLPQDCDTLLLQATGTSALDGEMREGIVFRDRKGERSFKAVSNEFLAKYHG